MRTCVASGLKYFCCLLVLLFIYKEQQTNTHTQKKMSQKGKKCCWRFCCFQWLLKRQVCSLRTLRLVFRFYVFSFFIFFSSMFFLHIQIVFIYRHTHTHILLNLPTCKSWGPLKIFYGKLQKQFLALSLFCLFAFSFKHFCT